MEDIYVGVMKGVIATLAPGLPVIDLTHGISRQDILQGGLRWAAAVPFFPPGTIHVAVHDGRAPEVISYTFYQGRTATKRRAVTTALFLLRRSILTHH